VRPARDFVAHGFLCPPQRPVARRLPARVQLVENHGEEDRNHECSCFLPVSYEFSDSISKRSRSGMKKIKNMLDSPLGADLSIWIVEGREPLKPAGSEIFEFRN
jgi:hypothetical protein